MPDTDALPELSERYRRFCEAYAGEAAANGVRAAEIAGYGGDYWTLATQASRLLKKAEIRSYLNALLENDPLVATRVERTRFLTRVMRGEETEVRAIGRDEEGKPIIENVAPSMRDRLAAQEALAKIAGDLVTKVAPTNAAGEDLKDVPLGELMAYAAGTKTA